VLVIQTFIESKWPDAGFTGSARSIAHRPDLALDPRTKPARIAHEKFR